MKKLLALIAVVTFVGCNKGPALLPLEKMIVQSAPTPVEYASVSASFLTRKARRLSGTLKIVMVVDTSGSNLVGRDSNGNALPGTDPLGQSRFETLKNFVASFDSYSEEDRENIYFSLITFDTSSRVRSGFTNDLALFRGKVQHEIDALADGGATDMPVALGMTYDLIFDDIQATKSDSEAKRANYVIIFVTDGMPMRVAAGQRYDIPLSEIEPRITAINDLGKANPNVQSITLNTGFYCKDICDLEE